MHSTSLVTSLSTTSRSERRDKARRRRLHGLVDKLPLRAKCHKSGVSPQMVKMALHALTDHSDDTAKPVWGHQSTYADKLECSVRHFQRCVAILITAGIVVVGPGELERLPNGQWCRRSTNRYYFVVPPGKQKPRSHLGDGAVAYKQQPTVVEKTLRNFDNGPPDLSDINQHQQRKDRAIKEGRGCTDCENTGVLCELPPENTYEARRCDRCRGNGFFEVALGGLS